MHVGPRAESEWTVGQVLFTRGNSGFGQGRMHVPMANTALSASATMTPARPARQAPPPTAGRLARQTCWTPSSPRRWPVPWPFEASRRVTRPTAPPPSPRSSRGPVWSRRPPVVRMSA